MNLQQALELLGLDARATKADVSRRYRHLAMTTHPDHVGDVGQTAMQNLNAARDLALENAPDDPPPADAEPDVCPRCLGKKKIKVTRGFAVSEVVCPLCQK